ncbi:MAG: metalloregulator ArsR/SmtB family transcription factor [Pseudomonadales bacterium]|nr:metalloregulator ArsR/SmtB family transcription factor [Pseudomonadales bacterium]
MNQIAAPDQSVDHAKLLGLCKASADALRLDILRVLSVESFGVMELCRIFDTAQPGMSHHLKVLSSAGLVQARREGNSIFYRRAIISADDPLSHFIEHLYDSIDRIPLDNAIEKQVQAVHRERARSSREFFEKNAARFKENQDLIAEFDHYAGCVNDLISNEQVPATSRVIEIGPGNSDLILMLADHFDEILAIDNSPEMLNQAREKVNSANVDNVTFLQGELDDLAAEGTHADMITLNMVLHHIASPIKIFEGAHRVLNRDGRLLIIDLCPHNQDWARDICGDLWLGFEPADLDNWADEVGLVKGQSVFLGLKNGFQVQVRLFHQPEMPQ